MDVMHRMRRTCGSLLIMIIVSKDGSVSYGFQGYGCKYVPRCCSNDDYYGGIGRLSSSSSSLEAAIDEDIISMNGIPLNGDTGNKYNEEERKLLRRRKFGFEPLVAVQSLAGSVHRVGKRQIEGYEDEDEDYMDGVSRMGNGGDGNDNLISSALRFAPSNDSDKTKSSEMRSNTSIPKQKNTQVVLQALASLERDMSILDNLTGQTSQLSVFEVSLLVGTVVAAAGSPFLPETISEVLAPASAAFSAAIGIGAEYIGKVAVSDGKEVAAATIMCAAESEGLLANAERVKAVIPLCVGVGATCVAFSLLLPSLINAFNVSNIQVITELYLFCPLVCVLSAAIASLTLQEVRGFCTRAISTGNRRFARAGSVGRTWLSQTEQIERNSERTQTRWKTFAASVIPAPLIGAIIPGTTYSSKAVIITALAACQSAFFLAQAEYAVARGTDAVSLKARSAAVSDTYANQGARNGAILPFTSALAALCAAATGAVVELPLPDNIFIKVGAYSIFPAFSALFSAAASVGKARCEVDAEAAVQAAGLLALEYDTTTTKASGLKVDSDVYSNDSNILKPFEGVIELIRLTASSSFKRIRQRKNYKTPIIFSMFAKFFRNIITKSRNKLNRNNNVGTDEINGSTINGNKLSFESA